MSDLILHHYDFSNYSEKVRVALGYKGLSWKSVIVPPVLPKPDLVALTSGYRRAPVLQIGADVYCDTRLILQELDRRFSAPTYFHAQSLAIANAVASWAETTFFRSVMLLAWGTNHDLMPPELFHDRAVMRGLPTPSQRSVEHAAARNAPLVRAQLPYIEKMLADGRPWICGHDFSVADMAVYHAIWFLTDRSDRLANLLDEFSCLAAWSLRVRQLGHGSRREISAREAQSIAASSAPETPRESRSYPEDPRLGEIVEVRPSDYAKDAVVGRLDLLDVDEVSIRLSSPELGDLAVHFPRIGFDLRATDRN
jgi:glutathione S-transferase